MTIPELIARLQALDTNALDTNPSVFIGGCCGQCVMAVVTVHVVEGDVWIEGSP